MFKQFFWNLYAQVYDSLFSLRPYRRMLEEVVEQAAIEPGMRVLDLGCGSGNLELVLITQGIDCQVTGVDYSAAMLRRARKKCRNTDWNFVQGDLTQLADILSGLPPFDRVISTNVLYAIAEPESLLKAAKASMKPGAIGVHTTPAKHFQWKEVLRLHLRDAHAGHYLRMLSLLPQLVLVLVLNLLLFKKETQQTYHFHTEAEIADLFAAAGFNYAAISRTYADQDWLIKAQNR
ncbi:MAG TPA: class I SAM-dependent methyltransferase [Candidatus Saccharimonas sp.]|nr:class I SAM-dependent methyltransferase [Candidatus Saccharimonas sp.]